MPLLDPMQLAREACARIADVNGEHLTAEGYRKGQYDGNGYMRRAIGAAELVMVAGFEAWPLPLVLHCPRCGIQHIDEPDPASGWKNPPHRSHACQTPGCGTIWRPADVATTGVPGISTHGRDDTWPGKFEPPPATPEENVVRRPLAGVDVLSGEAPA